MIQQSNEFSLSQLWILGGSFGEDLNSIEAGWQVSVPHNETLWERQITGKENTFVKSFLSIFLQKKQVSPDLYGDNNTRLFTYWTVS